MNIKCTCEPNDYGHESDCALNLELRIKHAENNLAYLKRKLSAALNSSKKVIYEIGDQPIALGNFFYAVKDNMEKMGVDGPEIEFAIINDTICVVEPE